MGYYGIFITLLIEIGGRELKNLSFIVVCIILVLCMCGCSNSQQELSVDELISLGEKFLLDMNYEQALIQFKKVIEIEPMNVRGYTGAAEAYIGLDKLDEAVAILQKGLEQTEVDEIKNMLNELKSEKGDKIHQAISEFDEYELSYFFKDVLPVELLTIGGIPFYMHTSDFEEESYREFGVQLNVDEDEVFAFVGSESFNEFAGLSIGMNLNEVLDTLDFTEEGISFIKDTQIKNSNPSISFNFSGNVSEIPTTHISDSTPYDLDIIIDYYDIEGLKYLYLVMGFYDDVLYLLEAHAGKDYSLSESESENTDITYSAEDFLGYSAQVVIDIFGDDYATSNDGGSTFFYYEDYRIPMIFFIGEHIPDNNITGLETIKYIAINDGEILPGINIGDTAEHIAEVLNVEYYEPHYSDYEFGGSGYYENIYNVRINEVDSTIYFQYEEPGHGCIHAQIKGNSLY
jgi:tetratricopeptide (TPR) repeat protein